MNDKEFAAILHGLNYLDDFKSIIYKQNEFGDASLEALEPLL